MLSVEVIKIRHRWPEKAGFFLDRPKGTQEYVLLHFLTPVEITIQAETTHAAPGSLIIFSPGVAYAFRADEPLLHDWMHITGNVEKLLADYDLKPNHLYQPNLMSAISDLTAFLETEFFSRHTYWPELLDLKLREIFIRTAHSLSQAQSPMNVHNETMDLLRETRAQILSEPWRAWSVAAIARNVNFSPSRLHAVYKAVFGISPRHDLILIRVEKAKQLLWGGARVSDVAERLGYSSVYHFIRQFKQITGKTPKQYSRSTS